MNNKTKEQEKTNSTNEGAKGEKKSASSSRRNRRDRGYNSSKQPSNKGGRDYKVTNPVDWYKKYAVLAEESSKLGFNHIKGTKYIGALDGCSYHINQDHDLNDNLLAIAQYITTPGIIKDLTSGFAMQIRRLYLAMKRKYRGLNTYQIADLGMTIYAIAEFYRYVAKLERIYGIFNYYNVRNRVVPNNVAAALLVDRDEIMANLANFRAGINALIIKSQSLCLPKGLDVVNRWFFLESNIFKDSDDARASYIIFSDNGLFYTYQPTLISTGGSVALSKTTVGYGNASAAKHAELLSTANDILDILLNDDDITLQLGDIVSYFTQSNGDTDLMVLQTIPEDYVVVPSYSEDILLQIHNADLIGNMFSGTLNTGSSIITTSNFDTGNNGTLGLYDYAPSFSNWVILHQQNGLPVFNLRVNVNVESSGTKEKVYSYQRESSAPMDCKCGNTLLDTWKEVPTPDDIMEMTRFKVHTRLSAYMDGSNKYWKCDVESCGTEIITKFNLVPTAWTGSPTGFYSSLSQGGLEGLANLMKIDWHPYVYLKPAFDSSGDANARDFQIMAFVWGDVDNARTFFSADLHYIHDAAIMSLFEVSSVEGFKAQ